MRRKSKDNKKWRDREIERDTNVKDLERSTYKGEEGGGRGNTTVNKSKVLVSSRK